jgi:hypothetical protein
MRGYNFLRLIFNKMVEDLTITFEILHIVFFLKEMISLIISKNELFC